MHGLGSLDLQIPNFTQKADTLQNFIHEWDRKYKNRLGNIKLFDSEETRYWTEAQKKYFAKIFYHARGHFHDFLWHLGGHTPYRAVKDIVIKNIQEELNYSAQSHEQMYFSFAESLGVDLTNEVLDQANYLDCIKEFNRGHLRFLYTHSPEAGFAAFSAYERLDNIDYVQLLNLAKSIGIKGKGLTFFKVHTRVEHFETTEELLTEIWSQNSKDIVKAFNFIAEHQFNLWDNISTKISSMENGLDNKELKQLPSRKI